MPMFVTINRACGIKSAVKIMNSMEPNGTGVMKITRDALVIEVYDRQALLPVVFSIKKPSFQRQIVTPDDSDTVRFFLLHMLHMLEQYHDDARVQFLFDPDQHFGRLEFNILNGQSIGASREDPNYVFHYTGYDQTNMISICLEPSWFKARLLDSWTHEGRVVLERMGVDQRRSIMNMEADMDLFRNTVEDNYQRPPPGVHWWHYNLGFFSNHYIYLANELSCITRISMGRHPILHHYSAPILTFQLDDFTDLEFFLPLLSHTMPVTHWTEPQI